MVSYLYMARIMLDTTNSYGFNNSAEAANKTDFETNYKSQTVPVSDLENAETTFTIVLTYAEFKAKIDGVNILWSDVKLETNDNLWYDLYLLTETPI